MTENENSTHKTILKATSIYGFMQVIKIVIGVIGSKFVAVFLGPIGIGIVGLLNNSISIIASFTNFGIATTSIREVSVANALHNPTEFSKRIIVLKRWSLIIGVFGGLVSIILSKYLSIWTFGNDKNYWWFIVLSINFIFSSYTLYQSSLLQGLQMMKSITLSSVIYSFIVTCITIPVYYFFKLNGILPIILLSSIANFLILLYFTKSIKIEKIKISLTETLQNGIPIMKLGFLLSINVIFGQICNYIIKLYLNGNGSTTSILGFYEVSSVLLLSYVGMVFNAMTIDFYPRLTAVQNDTKKVNQLVNDQIEIALLLITPLVVLFYLMAPILIQILYTKEFLKVLLILKFALFAVIIKAIIWPLAYIILAKGERKLYFFQELVSDFLNISLTITLYRFFGLIGIGMAQLINFVLYGFYVFFLLKNKFQFTLRKDTIAVIFISVLLGLLSCFSVVFLDYPISYFPLSILFLIAFFYSYKKLNTLIDINSYLSKIKSKLNIGNKN